MKEMRIARRLRRARRTLVVLGLFAVVTAVVAVAAPAAGAATTCSNVFTTHSTISSAPKIVVDVYGSGRATHDPAGVALGDYQLTIDQSYGNSGWIQYSDHVSSRWMHVGSLQAGPYDIWVQLVGVALPCRNPGGGMTIN